MDVHYAYLSHLINNKLSKLQCVWIDVFEPIIIFSNCNKILNKILLLARHIYKDVWLFEHGI